MNTSHTPGNWMAVGAWIEHLDDDVPDIANFDPASMGQEGRSDDEVCANARLCAAAPDMLFALKLVASHWPHWNASMEMTQIDLDAITLVRRAIRKATGDRA